ncbi:MAG: CapA family protein, partial [Deltaproteobacteria bacterium]|nr:CapA family protein [Deltaproteobacteria bacterium]
FLFIFSSALTGDSIRVAAVGDIMLGTEDRLPEGGCANLFDACKTYLKSSDIAFFNYEGTLSSVGQTKKKTASGQSFAFRTPPSYGRFLAEAGFNLASIANNHINDFGLEGKRMTMETLQRYRIAFSGPPGKIARLNVRGVRVAMVAFAPYAHSYYLLDIPAAKRLVAGLSRKNDIVIVSMHAGKEGEEAVRTPREMEFYYGEKRGEVVKFARAMIDSGADLVLGHGPHVPRAMEVYQGRLIAYSLGNFCTMMRFNVSGRSGFAPLLLAELDPGGRLVGGRIVSFLQVYGRPLKPDPLYQAAGLIHELGQLDFPSSNAVDKTGRLIVSDNDLP